MSLFASKSVGNGVRIGVSTGGGGGGGGGLFAALLVVGAVSLLAHYLWLAIIGVIVVWYVRVLLIREPPQWEAELRADAERRAKARDLREQYPPQ